MYSIEKILGLLAGVIIASAQVLYLVNTITKKVRPSVLSWFGWSILMGTSLVSQVLSRGWQWSMTGILCSTIGCMAIAAAAFFSRNFSLQKTDWWFVGAGLACAGLYRLSDDPWATTLFAIVADGVLAIPTIRKAIRSPETERTKSWMMGTISSTLALVICVHHEAIYWLFPVYLFFFNGGMMLLTIKKRSGDGVQ